MKPINIFISRDLDGNSKLKSELSSIGYNVIDRTLIEVSPIRFTHTPKCDWIFFSSKNAIKFFFAQRPVMSPATRFAVMGKGSAKALELHGKQASFIGKGNDSTAIAKEFVSTVDSEIVLFPQAIDSMQTVQRWLPFNNIVRNLFVYKTEPKKHCIVPNSDILVFTSPSNVDAFFLVNKISEHQLVIAIGTTTRLCLKRKGVTNAHIPESFDEDSLLEKIIEVIRLQSKKPDQIQIRSYPA